MTPNMNVEYPNCFAIVGKNDVIGATPKNNKFNY